MPIPKNISARELKPEDHFNIYDNNISDTQTEAYLNQKPIIDDVSKHFTRDVNDVGLMDKEVVITDEEGNQETIFSGSTTHINPTNDPHKNAIIKYGLEDYEVAKIITPEEKNIPKTAEKIAIRETPLSDIELPPLSPLHPFTRMNPKTAQVANLTTYNRTKLPIADLEFRKGFRHIFITRPECYIMSYAGDLGAGAILSEQAKYDSDFSSCWSRMPHILRLLSPSYVTGSFSQNDINSNWNYLLSNRVLSMSGRTETSIAINENVTKSVDGYTVTPASILESEVGSTIDLKFRDTKTFEVYEMLRMWMLYMYKRKKGIFAPPYNGYQYRNGFITGIDDKSGMPVYNNNGASSRKGLIYHPYDRALEYCASIFDIVTNESMTKIIHWTKYYGVYPTNASIDNLSNDMGGPITGDMTTSSTFKYHYKVSGDNKSLVEFNYNAGITSDTGELIQSVKASHPFLLRDDPDNRSVKQYIGGAGMFTGSPYIVLGKSQSDPLNKNNDIYVPYLRFMPLNDGPLNTHLNLGLTNVIDESEGIIAISDKK